MNKTMEYHGFLTSEPLKDVKGFEGIYRLSSLGYVISYHGKYPKRLVPSIDGWKYRQVYLCKNGQFKRMSLHRLIATYFIPNPDNKPEVNHKDGNKGNNHIGNLEWVTRSENTIHSFVTGLISRKGDKHNQNKLSSIQVKEIRDKLNRGVRNKDLMAEYKVSCSCICDIKQRRTWNHI